MIQGSFVKKLINYFAVILALDDLIILQCFSPLNDKYIIVYAQLIDLGGNTVRHIQLPTEIFI